MSLGEVRSFPQFQIEIDTNSNIILNINFRYFQANVSNKVTVTILHAALKKLLLANNTLLSNLQTIPLSSVVGIEVNF